MLRPQKGPSELGQAHHSVVRIGAVPYLNALPLCRYLPGTVRFETPAVLEQLMKNGDLDTALLPSFAFLKNSAYIPHYDGGVIQSNGAVESVILFYRNEIGTPAAIRSVSLSPDSVTSVALLKILFDFKWGKPFASLNLAAQKPDAFLKIGDAALFFDDPNFQAIDLGKEWTDWTGLPFVYALWVSRDPSPQNISLLLKTARLAGMKQMEEIIASCRDLPPHRLRPYLTKSIQYEIVPESIKGLALFQEYCLKMGLLKVERSLR